MRQRTNTALIMNYGPLYIVYLTEGVLSSADENQLLPGQSCQLDKLHVALLNLLCLIFYFSVSPTVYFKFLFVCLCVFLGNKVNRTEQCRVGACAILLPERIFEYFFEYSC